MLLSESMHTCWPPASVFERCLWYWMTGTDRSYSDFYKSFFLYIGYIKGRDKVGFPMICPTYIDLDKEGLDLREKLIKSPGTLKLCSFLRKPRCGMTDKVGTFFILLTLHKTCFHWQKHVTETAGGLYEQRFWQKDWEEVKKEQKLELKLRKTGFQDTAPGNAV